MPRPGQARRLARKAISVALERLGVHMDDVLTRMAELQEASDRATAESSLEKKAHLLADEVVPAMAGVREVCDRVEESVADEFWSLPKYREMLLLV